MTELADVPRERLDRAIATGPLHYRPIWLAVRDHGCSFAIVPQGREAFSFAADGKPRIVVIGDDLTATMGPSGFHLKSVRQVIRDSGAIVVHSGAAELRAYASAVSFTVASGKHSLVVETGLKHEQEWLRLVEAENPDAALMVVTVPPQGNA